MIQKEEIIFYLNEECDDDFWILDSGTMYDMTAHLEWFIRSKLLANHF